MRVANMALRLTAIALAACCAASLPAAAQGTAPIHVAACQARPSDMAFPGYYPGFYHTPYYWYDIYGYRYLQPPLTGNAMLAIEYVNVSAATARAIDFGLLAHGNLVAEVRDVGTFSPNATIKHEFGVDRNLFPLGTALYQCIPLRVEFTNGYLWVNPHLPRLRRAIYPHG